MISIWQSSLAEIRDTTASTTPVATSGAISVVTSVYACSLLRMSLQISGLKIKTNAGRKKIIELIQHVEQASVELSKMADKDVAVFHSFLEKFSMPDVTPAGKKLRLEEISVTRLEAIRIPLSAAETITKLYSVIFEAIPLCNANVLPDLAVTANMFYSAVTGLLWSVRTNGRKLKEAPRLQLENTARMLKTDAKTATKQVNKQVSKLLGIT